MKLVGLQVKVFYSLYKGGFGKVKVAKNKKNGKYYALKMLKKG